MKKILLTLATTLICSLTMADEMPVDYGKLPQSAKTFITKYFPSAKVTTATKDPEFMGGTEYTVYMNDGCKVDFNSKGAWKKVDCGMKPVPAEIIPAKISKFVKTNHPDTKVVKIDIDRTDYEIRLSNGMEMKFNPNGDLIGIDD